MSALKFAAMARKHWAVWLPKKTAELKASGELLSESQAVGQMAMNRVLELVEQGMQRTQAEAEAIREVVLVQPEPPDEDDWEAKELAEMEAEFQEQARAERKIDQRYEAEYLKEELEAKRQPQSQQSTSE